MKLQNKATQLKGEDGKSVDYAFLINLVVNVPVKAGITVKEMKRDIAILTKFENIKLDEEVELTEDELNHIITCTEDFVWAQRHNDITRFSDYLNSLK